MTEIRKVKGLQTQTTTSLKKMEKKERVEKPKDEFVKRTEEKGITKKVKDFWKENITGKEEVKKGTDFTTIAAIAGGGIGVGVGAYIGYEAGKLEEARALASHERWQVPVTERKHLGNIPHDYYTPSWWWAGADHVVFDEHGQIVGGQPVYRNAPVYNPEGTVKMQTVEKQITSQRYGVGIATVVGGLLGGIAGVLGGIAVALLAKIARKEE